jgi:hypothetical protein
MNKKEKQRSKLFPEIGTGSIDWAQLSRFFLKMETESSLWNVVFWNINRTVLLGKDKMMENVQKYNICTNVPLSQTFNLINLFGTHTTHPLCYRQGTILKMWPHCKISVPNHIFPWMKIFQNPLFPHSPSLSSNIWLNHFILGCLISLFPLDFNSYALFLVPLFYPLFLHHKMIVIILLLTL